MTKTFYHCFQICSKTSSNEKRHVFVEPVCSVFKDRAPNIRMFYVKTGKDFLLKKSYWRKWNHSDLLIEISSNSIIFPS